jgi:hypothetical protein
MTIDNLDPMAAVDALSALLAAPCPWWCDHVEEGHQWMADLDSYLRTHARVIGAFTIFAAERLNADGSLEIVGGVGVESHLDEFEGAEEARRYAADLVEVARVLDSIKSGQCAGA